MQAIIRSSLHNSNRKSVFSHKSRDNQTAHQSTKINSNNKFVPSTHMSGKDTFKTIQCTAKNPIPYSKNANSTTLTRGMNEHFLYARKQNHLNSCFNIRKNKLKELTKVNKQIFQKLNSQKSLYSSTDMNKSYQSTKQIKERLSQSKLSQRLSLSRQSSRKSLGKHNAKIISKQQQPQLKIKAENIKNTNIQELNKFKILFERDTNIRTKRTAQNNEEQLSKHNSYSKNQPYIRSLKITGRRSIQTTKQSKTIEEQLRTHEGGLLHRIAEDLDETREIKQRKNKFTLKHKKIIYF